MWIRFCFFCALLFFLFFPIKQGESGNSVVFEEKGNIFLKAGDKITQLTSTGRDSEPILSPNARWVAFNREIKGVVKECKRRDIWVCPSEELWVFDLKIKTEQKLLEPKGHEPKLKNEEVMENFNGKIFSPDSKTIYFSTPTYATASAIHAVNINGKNARFITAGHLVQIVQGYLPNKFKSYLANDLQEDDWRISKKWGGLSLLKKALNEDVTGYLIIGHSGIKINTTPTLLKHGWEGDDGKFYTSGGRRFWKSLDTPDGTMRIPIGEEE